MMANNPSNQRFGKMALAEVFPWLFAIDVFAELIGELKRGQEESWLDNLLYLLTLVGFALVIAPFALAFVGPSSLAWSQGASLKTSLLVGAAGEAVLTFWIRKKLSRDPKSRAFDRASKILAGNPQVGFEDLCEKVRKALSAEDKRAIRFADDMASRAWARHKRESSPRRGLQLFGFRIRFSNPFAGWLDFDDQISSFSDPKPSTRAKFGKRRGRLPGVYSPFSVNNRKRKRR